MLSELGIFCIIVMVLSAIVMIAAGIQKLKLLCFVAIIILVATIVAIFGVLPEDCIYSNIDIAGNLDDNQIYYIYNVSMPGNNPDIAVLMVQKVDATTGTFLGPVYLYQVPKAELPDGLETPEKIVKRNDKIEIWTPPF